MINPHQNIDKTKKCSAELYLYDDYGDNRCTICCGLSEGHSGPHEEKYKRRHGIVTISWYGDELMWRIIDEWFCFFDALIFHKHKLSDAGYFLYELIEELKQRRRGR